MNLNITPLAQETSAHICSAMTGGIGGKRNLVLGAVKGVTLGK